MNTAGDEQRAVDMAPGAALAAARTVQNLSIVDVARQLRLSPKQVEALEEGAFDRLPGPVFVRGFIRNYARLLRIDADRLLAGLDPPAQALREALPPSQNIPFPETGARRWPLYAAAMVAIVGGLAAYEVYWSDSREAVTTTVTSPGAAIAVQQPVTPPPAAAVEETAAPQAPAANGTLQETPPASPETNPAAPAEPSAASGAPAADMGRVVLVFEKESWVQIRDRNGRTVFLKHNPPGTEQHVSGLPPLTLVVGNAHGVRLTYNDRPVDLSRHAKDDVARFTLK